ncbi:uncharacterized protein TNCV_2930301 [Trichonephila clavipes]|nr:uncharacterized protein TNCV_2930301 [Trichonephila clavipes]
MKKRKCGTAPEVQRPGAPEGRGLIWLLHLQALAEQNGVAFTPWVALPGVDTPVSYGDYNRTSAYLITWTNRHRLKRDSPFSRMQAMDLLDQDIEEHFLKNVFNPQEGLPRVHFKPEMGAHTSKNQDPPEYLRQLALEIINKIPATAMQIYTDELWKTPPTHPWYNRQAAGGALSIKADRVVQTTISRLASGHIRGLSFNLGQKIYENCTKCNLVQATPDHLLFCAGLEREDIYSSPLLVYDFLRTLGLMDLV